MSGSTTHSVLFPDLFTKPIQVLFDESQMSSDGGGLLLKGVDEELGLTEALAIRLGIRVESRTSNGGGGGNRTRAHARNH